MNIFANNKMLHDENVIASLNTVGNTSNITLPKTLSIDIDSSTNINETFYNFIRGSGVKGVVLVGETMKHPEIVRIIQACRDARIGIHTDPIDWSKELIDLLINKIPTFIRIKYKEGFLTSYNQIKGVAGLTGCTYYLNSKNYTEVGAFMSASPDIEHTYLSVDTEDPLDSLQTTHVLQQLSRVNPDRFYYHNLLFSLENTKISKQAYDYCFFKDMHTTLKANGDLVSCNHNNETWGNINSGEELLYLWEKSRIRRNDFNPSEKCTKCIHRCKNEAVIDHQKNSPSHISFL